MRLSTLTVISTLLTGCATQPVSFTYSEERSGNTRMAPDRGFEVVGEGVVERNLQRRVPTVPGMHGYLIQEPHEPRPGTVAAGTFFQYLSCDSLLRAQ